MDSSNNQDNAQSEPLKDQGKYITVHMSVETPKTKDVKTPIKPHKIDEFTAQLAAMKVFFNEWGIWIEKRDRTVENSFSELDLNTENLKYDISFLCRESTFIKTELNNKQHIIIKHYLKSLNTIS